MARNRNWLTAAGAAIVVIIAVVTLSGFGGAREKIPLGLFSSLPIYWNESGSVTEALDRADELHWARTGIEQDYRLMPLDTLDGDELGRLDKLIMAQPRPLNGPENVALDRWVRDGGRLLLFADPFLTEQSRYSLGDKRRPQDVVLLSPILRRWGLELTFDEAQPESERTVRFGSIALPERLGGRMRLIEPGAPANCAVLAEELVANCRIGAGRVLVIADAALLETDRPTGEGAPVLRALLDRAFAD